MNSLRSVADSLCRSANDTGDNSTGVDPPYVTWNNKRTAKAAFDATAATLLAIQHFNTKNNSVVKDLSTLVSSCTVKLTVNVGDSQWDNDASVRQTIRTVAKHVNSEQSCPVPNGTVGPPPSTRNLQAPPSNQQVSSYFQDAFPCVLLGPTNEKAAKAVSTTTSALGLPQLVVNSASSLLLSVDTPTTVGVATSVAAEAQILIDYLQRPGYARDYILVLSDPKPMPTEFANNLEKLGLQKGLTVLLFAYDDLTEAASLPDYRKRLVAALKDTGIKTIVLNIQDSTIVVDLATELAAQGMFQSDYLYFLSSDAFPVDLVTNMFDQQKRGSPLDLLLSGAFIFNRLDGFRHDTNDPFLAAWQSLGADFVLEVNSLLPSTASFHASDDYFQKNSPSSYVSFVYDAVMTIGIGGCRQVVTEKQNQVGVGSGAGTNSPPANENVGTQPPNAGSNQFPPTGTQQPGDGTTGNDMQPPPNNMNLTGTFPPFNGTAGQPPPYASSNSTPPFNGNFSQPPPYPMNGTSLPPFNGTTGQQPPPYPSSNSTPPLFGNSTFPPPYSMNGTSLPPFNGTNGQQPPPYPPSNSTPPFDGTMGSPPPYVMNGTIGSMPPFGGTGGSSSMPPFSGTSGSSSNPPIGGSSGQQYPSDPSPNGQRNLQQGGSQQAESQSVVPPAPELVGLDPLVMAMTEIMFTGASGSVSFAQGTKTRDASGVYAGLYNIQRRVPSSRRLQQEMGSDVMYSYETVLVFRWSNSTTWESPDGVKTLYRDGTTDPPTVTREISDSNYLSSSVRAVGLTLVALAWILGFGSMIAVFVLRKDAIVQRAQPFFLELLCFGSVVMSVSIVTLSFDESLGSSEAALDAACMATPWFFFLGQIMTFSALFTKLWRLDKVLQFRRGNKVTISNVIAPLVVMLVITLVVLIVWSVVDPWTWNRIIISLAPVESYGQCGCDNFWAFFGPLMALVIAAEILTAFFAWKTSDVPEDFRDSNAVFYAILTQLQAWLIGIPILAVLGTSSVDATYFGRVLLIWIFAVSGVGIVVAPKIFRAIQIRKNPELRPRGSRVKVSGVFAPQSSGTSSRSMYTPSASSSRPEQPESIEE